MLTISLPIIPESLASSEKSLATALASSALTIDQDSIIAEFDCGYFQVGFEPNLFLVKPQTNNERIESIVNSINQAQSKAEKLYDLTT